MSSIFISHSSKDNEVAERIKRWLTEQGHVSLFLDFDPDEGIKAGSDWEQRLYRELRSCQAVIVLLTPNWLESKWCFAELVQAREKGKTIFVTKFEHCDDKKVLSDLQLVDFTSEQTDSYYRLAAGLKSQGLDPKDSFNWDNSRPPYPGLQSFDEKDAAIFFGRDTEIFESKEVLNSLRRKGGNAHSFVLFLGASGSGKSSLVRAGLLPRLRKDCDNWIILQPFRPHDDPFEELAASLAEAFSVAGQTHDMSEIYNQLKGAVESDPAAARKLVDLIQKLKFAMNHHEATVLMVIDQAEELLGNTTSGVAGQFLRLLRMTLAIAGSRLMVLATMRSDFLSEFQNNPELAGFEFEIVPVGSMLEDNFPIVIERPAVLAGLKLEDGLVSTILKDVATPDALPLLAFTLRQLYDRFGNDGILTIHQYQVLGGIEGSVRRAADRVIKHARPTAEDLEALRSAFIPNMVRINEDGQYSRRQAYRDQFAQPVECLLNDFVDARLLISGHDQRKRETLEIAHEALLRSWPTSISWLEEDKYQLRLIEALRRAAREWQDGLQAKDLLTHREGRLRDTQGIIKEKRFALAQNSIEKRYLNACEESRLQQELAEKRRTRWTIGSLFAVIILLLGIYIAAERGRANAVILSKKIEIDSLFSSKKYLEALVKGLEGNRQLQNRRLFVNPRNRSSFQTSLAKVIYSPPRKQKTTEGHGAVVSSVSFSADGKIFASGSWDGTVKLWSIAGALLRTLQGHGNVINSLSFSPDSKMIASGSWDGTVKLWSVEGKLLHTLEGHSGSVRSVSFNPDGNTLASGSSDKTVKLWSVEGTLVRTLEGHSSNVTSVSFSPDGNILASGSADKTVKLWTVEGTLMRTLEGHKDKVNSVSFSTDGKTVASGSRDRAVKLWSLGGRMLRTLKGHGGAVSSVSYSPDGKNLASGGWDGTVKVWSVEGALLQTLEGHDNVVYSVTFSPDGKTLASGGEDKTVKFWNIEGVLLHTMKGHGSTIWSVSFSPDGKTLASGSEDKTVKLWSVEGALLQTLKGHAGEVISVAYSPIGQTLASGSWDKTVKLWSKDGALLRTFEGHGDAVYSVSFSPDGKTLASGSWDGTIKLWSTKGALLQTLEGRRGAIFSVSFSPDGKTLASGGADGVIKLWSVGGILLRTLEGHENAVSSVSFSPDGTTLASGSEDMTVKLWSVEGVLLKTLDGHGGIVTSVKFSPDGKTLASGSWDDTVKLWSVQGELLHSLSGHGYTVTSVSFNPDGNTIATGSWSTAVKLWKIHKFEDLPRLGCRWMIEVLRDNSKISDDDKKLCVGINL